MTAISILALITAGFLVVGLVFLRHQKKLNRDLKTVPFAPLPTSKFVQVERFHIHYTQTGRGPHLLLIHGLGASQYCWRFIQAKLAEHFTVTAVDLPGFGRSSMLADESYGLDEQVDRIYGLLISLSIQQVRVVGCSMGGAVSLWLAKKYPDVVYEVSVLAPAISPQLIPMKVDHFSWVARAISMGVNAQLVRRIYERVVTDRSLITNENVQAYLQPYINDRNALKTFFKATELIRDPRLPDSLAGLQQHKL